MIYRGRGCNSISCVGRVSSICDRELDSIGLLYLKKNNKRTRDLRAYFYILFLEKFENRQKSIGDRYLYKLE